MKVHREQWLELVIGALIGAGLGAISCWALSQQDLSAAAHEFNKLFDKLLALPPTSQSAGILGTFGLSMAGTISIAIWRAAAQIRIGAAQRAAEQIASCELTDATWRSAVEQVISDTLGEAVTINAFSGMMAGPAAWIRFVGRDTRAYVFAARPYIRGCQGWGRRIDVVSHPAAIGELRALWRYFMTVSGQATPVARSLQWYALPPQLPADTQRQAIRRSVGGAYREPLRVQLRRIAHHIRAFVRPTAAESSR